MRNVIIRGFVAAVALLAVSLFAIDWNAIILTGTRRYTVDASLQGNPVQLQTRVSGYLTQAPDLDYQFVHKGELLFQVEQDDYRARLARAEAAVAAGQAAVQVADAQVAEQQARLGVDGADIQAADASLLQAQQEQQRQAALLHTESYLARQWELAVANVRSAAADKQGRVKALAAAQAQVAVLQARAGEARAQLQDQQAALDYARIQLGWTRITAPQDGIVTARLVRQGAYVAAGTALITVVPEAPVWVVANYREVALTRMFAGQRVDVHVDALPGVLLHGHVDSIEPESQAEQSALPPDRAVGNFTFIVQRVPVKIDLDPAPQFAGRLRPGLSAETWVDTNGASP